VSHRPIHLIFTIFGFMSLTGCSSLLGDVPSAAALPTLTPGQVEYAPPTHTPTQVSAAQIEVNTAAPTITLTPAIAATLPVGPTATLEPGAAPRAVNEPQIAYFAASPEAVNYADEILLFWSVSNATSATLQRLTPDGTVESSWDVLPEDSLKVTAVTGGRNERYVLIAANDSVTVEAVVDVAVSCPRAWFFAQSLTDGCPTESQVASQAQVQQFEHGRMFRIEATREIVIIFEDLPTGSIEPDRPAWLLVADTFTEGEPETAPDLQPPAGLLQPRSNLGKVWREASGVRDRLGWATGEATTFNTIIQREDLGATENVYFIDETDSFIHLVAEGQGWLVIGFR
jgi:hypothetical protein